jgi:4-hydroxy-tetrahydrodipicolinate reductase
MTPVAVGLLGGTGAMGRHVVQLMGDDPSWRLVAAPARAGSPAIGSSLGAATVGLLGPGAFDGCDVVIDFSTPMALGSALPWLGALPLVSGTTGLSTELMERLRQRSVEAPTLHAANFSVGVTLLADLVQRAVRAMPDADLEVVEVHHGRKRDAPSGTALLLGASARQARDGLHAVHGREGAAGPRDPSEIGYHSVRGGDVVGEHTFWLLAHGERVALQHIASSRETFAAGALRAARWLRSRPAGAYTMADVLELR